jgi:hypothetical protein
MPVNRLLSKAGVSYKLNYSKTRSLEESRRPKKGGADPGLFLREAEGKSWAEDTTDGQFGRGHFHPATILAVSVW